MNRDQILELRKRWKRPNKYMNLSQRFWYCIEREDDDECWEWIGSKTNRGYGNIEIDRKTVGAHRLSWMIHFGEIPDDLHVLHRCDNPSCVNPKHLFLGDNQDNVDDKVEKERQYKGTDVWQAKLNPQKVREIRSLYKTGNYSYRELADMFGLITHAPIGRIVREEAWKHVK